MFDNVVAGVDRYEAGRDAAALAASLRSRDGDLLLAYVEVISRKPAPDSGAVGDAAKRRSALRRLGELRDEWSIEAEVSCVEAL